MIDRKLVPAIAHFARQGKLHESDATLLEQFAQHHDENAFRALVDRHSGMVLGVCRRLLAHTQDAEDAFQATFLVLARSAAKVRRPDSLGCWLYGVARRIANKVRAKRRRSPVPNRVEGYAPAADMAAAWRELQIILDDEVARLPARYREPLILCGLGDVTLEEAALQLKCPVGTVKSRLTRARERLRERLIRRGIAPASAGVALTLGTDRSSASVSLMESTMSSAIHPVAGATVTRLADAVLRSAARAKIVATSTLAVALLAGITWATNPVEPPVPPPKKEGRGPVPASTAVTPSTVLDALGDPLPNGAMSRLGSTRFRHMHTVRSVAFTTYGRSIITRSWDDTSRVWSVPDGKEVRRVKFPYLLDAKADPGDVKWAVIAPDGITGLSYGKDGRLRFTDLPTGKVRKAIEIPEFAAPTAFVRGAFRADGRVVAALANGTVTLWDIQTADTVKAFEIPKAQADLVMSPDGKMLAVIYKLPKTADGKVPSAISLWDIATGKELRQLTGPAEALYQAAFSPDGTRLVSGGGGTDTAACIWNVFTGKQIVSIPGRSGWVRPVTFSPDGKLIAVGGQDGIIRLYDAANGRQTQELRIPGQDDVYGPWVMSVAFNPDGKTLVSTGTEKAIRTWDLATGREATSPAGHQDEVTAVVVTPDGKTAISAGKDSALIVWDLKTGRERDRWLGHRNGIAGLALSPDGVTLVSIGKTVQVWDVAKGKPLRELAGHTKDVKSVAYSPDGKTMATMSDGDHTIRVWESSTGRQVQTIGLPNPRALGSVPLTYANGGRWLVSGSDDRTDTHVYVWDTATGRELHRLDGPADRLATSPDGNFLALGSWDTVRLVDLETGEDRWKIEAPSGCCAFSPDGNTLAIGTGDGSTRLVEVATGFERGRLQGHQSGRIGRISFAAGVSCLAFTADGRTLVTGAGDTTLLTWDLAPHPSTTMIASERRAAWWKELAGEPAGADRAMKEMLANPATAVAELKERLHPVAKVDGARVAELIRRLESDRFAEREKATTALIELGEAVIVPVRSAREKATTEEVRTRLDTVLKQIRDGGQVERQRVRRALEILERVRTDGSIDLLKGLAAGADGVSTTESARSGLARINAKR